MLLVSPCSVTPSCPTLCDPVDWGMPGFPVLHYFRVCSISGSLSPWCHPIISSSVVPFSSCHQSFPTSGSFLMRWLFASGGQSIGASASVLPGNRWVAPKTATHAAGIGQQKEPNSSPRQYLTTCCTINASEVEWIGLWCFASSIIFTWPLVNQLSLLQPSRKLFGGKTLPQPAGGRKCFPRVWWIPKHRFYTMGINQLISYWQKCVDCSGSCFA